MDCPPGPKQVVAVEKIDVHHSQDTYYGTLHTCYNISGLVKHDISTIQPVTTAQSFSESVQRRRTAQHGD